MERGVHLNGAAESFAQSEFHLPSRAEFESWPLPRFPRLLHNQVAWIDPGSLEAHYDQTPDTRIRRSMT